MDTFFPYPMLLKPFVSEPIWGSEQWVCSAHEHGQSVIINGAYAGRGLRDVLEAYGFPPQPLPLVKIIEAREKLSVQVHPADGSPILKEGERGKTECWLILEAAPKASLVLGLERQVAAEAFQAAIAENALEPLLHYEPVRAGNAFFIPPGTIHAIGGGITLAEVQQCSDTTYRIYDYGRLQDGKPRQLHTEQALAVSKLQPVQAKTELPIECAHFKTYLCRKGTVPPFAFLHLLVLEGTAAVQTQNFEIPLRQYGSLLLPPGFGAFEIKGTGTVLASYGKEVQE
ncbi:MAG: class I mannose-6-phosphate isomerase [Oscillospiraceae bacterium]|nr:class I mannose-6-phosphate isomerase [Oscillospiraceae bacterium]